MTTDVLSPGVRGPNINRQVRVSSGLNVLLGVWVAVSPWVFWVLGFGTAGMAGAWGNVIPGGLAALFAGIRIWGPDRRSALSWVNAALGGLIGLSPWIFDYASNDLRMWNSVVAGALISMLASWSASTTTVYGGHRTAVEDPRRHDLRFFRDNVSS